MRTSTLLGLPLGALLLASLTSCVGVSSRVHTSTYDGAVVAERSEDDYDLVWSIGATLGQDPVLERHEERTAPIAFLGVRVRDMDQGIAATSGLPAYRGLWVSSVETGSAAARGGLRLGDVLLSLGGVEFTSVAQFQHALRTQIEPEKPATAQVLRYVSEKTYEPVSLTITPAPKRTTETVSESVTLEGSRAVRELVGMQVGEVPGDLVEQWAGEGAGPQVWIAQVSPGGPAYDAGLRPGDRIVELDGEPLVDLDQLRGAVVSRAQETGIGIANHGETIRDVSRTAQGPLAFVVDGRLGRHTASVDVIDDLDDRTGVDIPILFEYESDRRSTRWSLLDFIFQFGANYSSRSLASSNRKPAKSTFFSMLPFGFFEVEKEPGYARYCIFWFIEWETNG